MTIQQIVDPSNIESELIRMWDELAKNNKIRASLFNLIVFTRFSPRIDYFRKIVQKVVEKFPCRTLFISHDPHSSHRYLKSAISVVMLGSENDASIACDQIDIGIGGTELEEIVYLILPHLIPDLPNYLLWAEDPSLQNPLLPHLVKLATRVIFDSESTGNLFQFAKTILQLREESGIDIGDLNWARTSGWRDLIASSFDSLERQELLKKISLLKIFYNAQETEFFCHLKIQAMYLLAWMSSRLHWAFQQTTQPSDFHFEGVDASIHPEKWEKLGPGTVISVHIHTIDKQIFEARRIPQEYHYVNIQISTPDRCELPYHFVLGQTATGQSLVQEICTKGTSSHYLKMLEELNRPLS
ncbi:MAG TPA: glucose-6-phosphate dehydrogenase assembly protein OpcA [Chlamydiales bacterium]|nr:glucose-6-phosphate dehydrogenase assembly protein OpcA [Chlamydiales bacterium]